MESSWRCRSVSFTTVLCCLALASSLQLCIAREYMFRRAFPQPRREFVSIERIPTVLDDVPSMLSLKFAFRTYLPNTRITIIIAQQTTGEYSELLFDLKHGRLNATWKNTASATTDIDVRYDDGKWHEVQLTYDAKPAFRVVVDGKNQLDIIPKANAAARMAIRAIANVKLRSGNIGMDNVVFYGCFRLQEWGGVKFDQLLAGGNTTKILEHNAVRGCTDLCADGANRNNSLRCMPEARCLDYYDSEPSCDWQNAASATATAISTATRVLTLNGGDLVKYELDVERIPLSWQTVSFSMEFLLAADENDNGNSDGNGGSVSVTKTPMQFVQFESTPDQQMDKHTMSLVIDEDGLALQQFVNGRRVNQIQLFRLDKERLTRFWHKLNMQFIELNRLHLSVSYENADKITRLEQTVEISSAFYFDSALSSQTVVFLGGNKDDLLSLFRGCLRKVYVNEISLIQQFGSSLFTIGFLQATEFDGSSLELDYPNAMALSKCRIKNRFCGPSATGKLLDCENGGVCGRTSSENRCFCTRFFEGRSCQFPVYLRTCDHYYRAGLRTSGYRYLQPLSTIARQVTPAIAYCEMANSSASASFRVTAATVLSPDVPKENDGWLRVRAPLLTNDSLSFGSVLRLYYNDAARDFLAALVTSSAYCEQELRYRSASASAAARPELRLANATHMMTAYERDVSPPQLKAVVRLYNGNSSTLTQTAAMFRSAEEACASKPDAVCEVATVFNSTDLMPLTDLAFFSFVPIATPGDLEVRVGSLKCFGSRMAQMNAAVSEQFETVRGITLTEKNHPSLLLPPFTGNTFTFSFRIEDNGKQDEMVLFEQPQVLKISFVAGTGFTKIRTVLLDSELMEFTASDSLADMKWHRFSMHFENYEARIQLDWSFSEFVRLERDKQEILQLIRGEARRKRFLRLSFNQTNAVIRDVQYGDPPELVNFQRVLDQLQSQAVYEEGFRLGTVLQCDRNPCQRGGVCKEDWVNRRTTCECADPIGDYGDRCQHSLSSFAVSLDGRDYVALPIASESFDKNLTFYFRTFQPNAVIMSLFGGDWKERYVSFELVDGHLRVVFPSFLELLTPVFSQFVADGRWHRVELQHFEHDPEAVNVLLDGRNETLKASMFSPASGRTPIMYLGTSLVADQSPDDSPPYFEGCIFANVTFSDGSRRSNAGVSTINLRDVALGKTEQSELRAMRRSSLHPECVTDCDVDTVEQTCRRGNSKARCVPVEWQSSAFTCDCPNSWLSGNSCTTDYGLCVNADFEVIASCRRTNCLAQNITFAFKVNANTSSTIKENVVFQMQTQSTAVEMVVLVISGLHNLILRQRNGSSWRDERTVAIVEPGSYYLVHISKLLNAKNAAFFRIQLTSRGTQAMIVNVAAGQARPLRFDRLLVGRRFVGCINNFIVHVNGRVHNLIQTGLELAQEEAVATRRFSDLVLSIDTTKRNVTSLTSDACRVESGASVSTRYALASGEDLERRFAVRDASVEKIKQVQSARVFPLHTYLRATLSAAELNLLSNNSVLAPKLRKALASVERMMLYRDEMVYNLSMDDSQSGNQGRSGILLSLFNAKMNNLTREVYSTVRETWLVLNQVAPEKQSYDFVMDRGILEPPRSAVASSKGDTDWIKLGAAVAFVGLALLVLSIAVLIRVRMSAARRRAVKLALSDSVLKTGQSHGNGQKRKSKDGPKAQTVSNNKRLSFKNENGHSNGNGNGRINSVRYAACSSDDQIRLVDHAAPITPVSIRAYPSPAPSRISSMQPNYVHYDDVDSQHLRSSTANRESVVELFDDELNRPIGTLRRIRALRFEGEEDANGDDTESRTHTNTSGSLARSRTSRTRPIEMNDHSTRLPVVFRKGRSSNFNDNFLMYAMDTENAVSLANGSYGAVSAIRAPVAKIDSVIFQSVEPPPQLACYDKNGHGIDPEREIIILGSFQSRQTPQPEEFGPLVQSTDCSNLICNGSHALSSQATPEFPPPPAMVLQTCDGHGHGHGLRTCPVKHVAVSAASASILGPTVLPESVQAASLDAPLSNGSHSSNDTAKSGNNNLDCSSGGTSSNATSIRNSVMEPVWVKADGYGVNTCVKHSDYGSRFVNPQKCSEDEIVWYRQMC